MSGHHVLSASRSRWYIDRHAKRLGATNRQRWPRIRRRGYHGALYGYGHLTTDEKFNDTRRAHDSVLR